MSIQLSTGIRNYLLDTGGFDAALNGGLLNIYDGTPPAGPDDAISGNTLLCTISVNGLGGGLNFESAAVAGVLSKAAAETWQGTNAASGNASFFRFYESGGTPGGASTTEKRIQGTVGVAGADLNLSSVALVASAVQTIDYFNVTLPATA